MYNNNVQSYYLHICMYCAVLNYFFSELDKRVMRQLRYTKKRNVLEQRERETGATIGNYPAPAVPRMVDKEQLKGNHS